MAYRCAECGVGATGRVTRRGDEAVSWACPQHLAPVCDGTQRDDEVTELAVVLIAKLVERQQPGGRLQDIVRDDAADS